MSYLDRYVATQTINNSTFQLASITALHIASKIIEPRKVKLTSLVDMASHGYFTVDHVSAMEETLLHSLDWRLLPPTPLAFSVDLMKLVSQQIGPQIRRDVAVLSRFIIELSVHDYYYVRKKPSAIALASIINAIELQGSARIDPSYKAEFLYRVVEVIGIDLASDEFINCYRRLRETFIAGDFMKQIPYLNDNHLPDAAVSLAAASCRIVSPSPRQKRVHTI